MNDASEIYTLTAEAAAARCRELLTIEKPPSSGAALKARLNQPPSEIITNDYKKLPYEQRMWSPAEVDRWCAERHPPRMRKAFACLAALERAAEDYGSNAAGSAIAAREQSLVREVLAEILAAGDEP